MSTPTTPAPTLPCLPHHPSPHTPSPPFPTHSFPKREKEKLPLRLPRLPQRCRRALLPAARAHCRALRCTPPYARGDTFTGTFLAHTTASVLVRFATLFILDSAGYCIARCRTVIAITYHTSTRYPVPPTTPSPRPTTTARPLRIPLGSSFWSIVNSVALSDFVWWYWLSGVVLRRFWFLRLVIPYTTPTFFHSLGRKARIKTELFISLNFTPRTRRTHYAIISRKHMLISPQLARRRLIDLMNARLTHLKRISLHLTSINSSYLCILCTAHSGAPRAVI